jgi:hypothetical protein
VIVPRAQWSMPGPLGPPMKLPALRLYLHHSFTAASNGPGAVRTVANIGIERFGRASYSYACTPDGTLYEMQGDRIGAHTARQNSTSLAVVLIGNYEVDRPTLAQVRAVAWLHQHLTGRGWLRSDAPLLGHRDAPGASTACPGRHAYALLGDIRRLITHPPEEDWFTMATKADLEQVVKDLFTDEPGTAKGYALGQLVKRLKRELEAESSELRQLLVAAVTDAGRAAIVAELGDTPDDTLGKIIRRLERELRSEGGRLHTALDELLDDRQSESESEPAPTGE